MRKLPVFLWISLAVSLVLLFMNFFVLAALLACITLSVCGGLSGVRMFAIMSLVFVVAVYAVFKADVPQTMLFCLFTIPVAVFLGLGFHANRTFAFTVVPAALVETLTATMIIYVKMKAANISAVSVLVGDRERNLKLIQSILPKEINVEGLLKSAYYEMDLILPALLVIFASVACLAVYLISVKWLRKNGKQLSWLPSFSELYLSRGFSAIYMVILIITLFANTGAIMLNVYTVLSGMFFFCGLSLCAYGLRKTKLPGGLRIAIIILAVPTSVLLVFPATLMSMLGLIDSTRNFRKLIFREGRLERNT